MSPERHYEYERFVELLREFIHHLPKGKLRDELSEGIKHMYISKVTP